MWSLFPSISKFQARRTCRTARHNIALRRNKYCVVAALSLQSYSNFLCALQKQAVLWAALLMDLFSKEHSRLHLSNKEKLVAISVSEKHILPGSREPPITAAGNRGTFLNSSSKVKLAWRLLNCTEVCKWTPCYRQFWKNKFDALNFSWS